MCQSNWSTIIKKLLYDIGFLDLLKNSLKLPQKISDDIEENKKSNKKNNNTKNNIFNKNKTIIKKIRLENQFKKN